MMRKLINKSCLSLRPPLPYATRFCFVAEKLSALYLIHPCPAAGSPGPSARFTGPYGATVERRAVGTGQGKGLRCSLVRAGSPEPRVLGPASFPHCKVAVKSVGMNSSSAVYPHVIWGFVTSPSRASVS